MNDYAYFLDDVGQGHGDDGSKYQKDEWAHQSVQIGEGKDKQQVGGPVDEDADGHGSALGVRLEALSDKQERNWA